MQCNSKEGMLMKEIEKPKPDETLIVGDWIEIAGAVSGDSACKRIQNLTTDYLTELGKDESGWDTLYRDPEDGRFWERIYRMSHMHGGGPPALLNLSEKDAREKYASLFA